MEGRCPGAVNLAAPKQQEIVDWMELPPWFNVPGFTQLFRREILSATALWPMSLSAETANQPLIHDQFVTFISNSLGKVGYIDRPLAKYRQHDHNAIGWSSGSPSFLRRRRYRRENRVHVLQP